MLKAVARRFLSKDHWLFLSWYKGLFGSFAAIRAYLDLIRGGGIARAPNDVAGGFVALRPGTTDQNVYREVFVERVYDLKIESPRVIVDAGAHIGLASVFLASRYRRARIVAIEPEVSNFRLLLKNAQQHRNIEPIRAGLWSHRTSLRIEDSTVSQWSFRVAEEWSGKGIPALGVSDLMSELGISEIDLLKMDIEGAELEVLSTHRLWLPRVRAMIIELHDRFRPGCSTILAEALNGYTYDTSESGECVVITNLRRFRP